MAFDSGGNLFVADGGNENAGSGAVYKFTPAGVRISFALGLSNPAGLAFDSAGNLLVAEFGEINGGPGTGRTYKITPNGVQPLSPPDCLNLKVWLLTGQATCLWLLEELL